MEKNGYKFNKISINYFVALCLTVSNRKEGLKSYALQKIELEQKRKEENKKGSIIKKVGVHQYLLSRQLYWTLPQDKALAPLLDKSSFPLSSLGGKEKAFESSKEKRSLIDKPFFIEKGNIKESFIDFFPYRKSFLCYWLLPFVGFAAVNVNVNKKDYFTGRTFEAPFVLNWAQKGLEDSGKAVTSLGEVSYNYNSKGKNKMEKENNIKEHCILYLQSLENYVMDWEALTSQKKQNNNLGFRESLLYPLGKKEVTKKASLWSSSYINLNLFKKEQKSNVSLFKGECALTCSPIKREEIKESEKANKQTGSWFGSSSAFAFSKASMEGKEKVNLIKGGVFLPYEEKKMNIKSIYNKKENPVSSFMKTSSILHNFRKKELLKGNLFKNLPAMTVSNGKEYLLPKGIMNWKQLILSSFSSEESAFRVSEAVKSDSKAAIDNSYTYSSLGKQKLYKLLIDSLNKTFMPFSPLTFSPALASQTEGKGKGQVAKPSKRGLEAGNHLFKSKSSFEKNLSLEKEEVNKVYLSHTKMWVNNPLLLTSTSTSTSTSYINNKEVEGEAVLKQSVNKIAIKKTENKYLFNTTNVLSLSNANVNVNANVNANEKDLNKLKEKNYLTNYGAFVKKYTLKIKNLLLVNEFKKSFSPIGKERMENVNLKASSHLHSSTSPLWNAYNKGNLNLNEHKKIEKLLRAYFSIKNKSIINNERKTPKFLLLKDGTLQKRKRYEFYKRVNNGMKKWFDKETQSSRNLLLVDLTQGKRKGKFFNLSPLEGHAAKVNYTPRLLIGNRSFILFSSLAPTSNLDLNLKGVLRNESPKMDLTLSKVNSSYNELLDKETNIEKERKSIMKKRRRKKLKKETRRRKKRKRFYPRPVWLRYRLYLKFIKRRSTSQTKVGNKALNNSKVNMNINMKEKELNLRQSIYRKYNKGLPTGYSEVNTNVLFPSGTLGKNYFTISRPVLGDLKRLLWKSYWLRSNLNPYLKRVKSYLTNMKQCTQKMEYIYNFKNIYTFLGGFVPNLASQPIQRGKWEQIKNDSISTKMQTNTYISTGKNKWENSLYFAEYNRITYLRIQELIYGIRENFATFNNNNKFVKARTSHLSHRKMQDNKREDVFSKRKTTDFWVKLGKAIMAENQSLLKESLLKKNKEWWLFGNKNYINEPTISQLRMLWALSKTSPSLHLESSSSDALIGRDLNNKINKNYNSFLYKRKGIWVETGKMREQLKYNKTKKMYRDIKRKLQTLLNEQYEIVKSFDFNGVSINNKKIKSLLEKRSFQQNLETDLFNNTVSFSKDELFKNALKKTRQKEEKLEFLIGTKKRFINYSLEPQNLHQYKKLLSLANSNSNSISNFNSNFDKKSSILLTREPWLNTLTSKSSYWWINENATSSPIYRILFGNIFGSIEDRDLQYVDKSNSSNFHFFFNGKWDAASTSLLYGKNENKNKNILWISTLLFHFCTILSLISISQIRDVLKFYLLGISKVYKASLGILTYSYTSYLRLKANYNYNNNISSSQKQKKYKSSSLEKFSFSANAKRKKINKFYYSSLISKSNSSSSLSFQSPLRGSGEDWKQKLTSDSSLLSLGLPFLSRGQGENEKEKENIKGINKKLLLALQLLSTEKQKENSIPISSSSNQESGEVLKLNVKNLKNKNVVLVQLVKMLRSLIKNPILLLKSMDVNRKEKLPYLNKYAVLYSFVAVNLLLSNSYNLYWNSKKLLKQTFDVLGRFGPKSLFNFLEKPGEQIIDWIAYMFLVEWASDMTNTIPENVDIYLGNSFYKMTRQIYSFNLYLYLWQNWGIKNTYTSNAIGAGTAITPIYGVAVQQQGEKEAVLKSPFLFETNNFSILNLATPFIQRRIYHLYEILLFQFYQPDTDLIVRQRKGVLFWDIWGDFLMGVAEDSNINISELTSLKEEQIKLLEKSTELISNENNSPFSTTSFAFTKAKARILKKDSLKRGYDVKLLNKGKSNLSNTREGNKGLLQMENNNFAAQQFLSYQGKDTELFIDLHPPKSFSTFSLLKKNESVGTSVGSLVCQIFAGIMSKQISKNILIIGSNSRTIGSQGTKSPYSNLLSATEGIESSISGNLEGREKTLLIQAIAGETELKIITDNAYRYAMVYRGVAVGIKLLRDVFDSLSLHTPCLFLIEDIHAIGERRPLLISDDEKGASPNGKQIFGSQREEIHEKNQVLYQLSKHVITHYGKPYKGDFSLLIPTNHYCFDLFRNHNLRFLNARQNTLSFNSPKIPVQSNETDISSSSYSSGKEKRELEKNKNISLSTLFSTFADSSINKYTSNINILGGEGTGDKQENYSRLLFKSSQLFSPPATSPFSVLNLKEEKKFKPHKIVSEMPWGGLPGEQLASVSKASYSIRVKVAMLADMAISTLSVKLDMITDLLVIIDSVKGNRGFVVFATTHVPYILDPALRRPGRLDETITLGIFPNLLSRWDIFKSSFSLFTAGKQQTGFYNGISMDLTYSINSPLRILNKQTLNYKNSFLKYKYGLYPTTKLLLNTQPFNFGQSKNKNKLTTNKQKNELLQTTLSLSLNKQDGNYKKRYLQKILSQTYFIASNMLYEAYTNSCLPLTSAACKVNKNHSLKQHIQPVNFIDYLQPLNMETSSLYMSLYASPLQFKNEIVKLMSGKLGEMLLFSSSVSFGDSNLLSLLDKNIEVGDRGKETIQYQSQCQCQWNEVMPTSLGLSNTWKVLSSLILSFVQKRFLLLSNSNNNLNGNGKESIINNNLIVPKFLFFNNQNSLYEPPSPPSSNILLPARRYENYRRSFAYFSGKKTSIGIMEKIATHQQQRLVKKLYGFSVKESFKSEIIENRFTSFTNATLMIGSFSSVLQKPSHSNWFVKNRILMRHKDYLTNQWWNGQLPEHNAETTFLSDIDWRYSFIESIGDLLLDFPDADQHYNPKNRRWLLTKGDYHNWFDFEKTLYSEIYTHFIFNSFVKAYHIYEKNREILDFYSFYVLRKGLYNTLNEFETIKLYKRFFCK